MFSGHGRGRKRTRPAETSVTQQKIPAKNAPRLPDYLRKHPDASAIQNLFAHACEHEFLEELMTITRLCHEQHFDLTYFHDWLAIYCFLRDLEQVSPYLDQLEEALQEHAGAKKRIKFTLTDDEKFSLPETKRNPYDHKKILSAVIYEWAKDNGFRQRVKYVALTKSSTFMSMLRARSIFKDSSVSADIHHGSWPHPIQWYCIVEHHKLTKFLRHDPLTVLQSFGDDTQLATAKSSKLAWDLIVDRFDRNIFFASPYFITEYLSQPGQIRRWPLLGESIKRQEEKSRRKYGDYRGYTKHLAEKHDGETIIVKKF